MKVKLFTHIFFVCYLSKVVIKIKINQFYLPGIDHFLSGFPIKMNRKNPYSLIDIFEIVHGRIIHISVIYLVKMFNSFDLQNFKTENHIPEFEIITLKKTFLHG